MVDLGRYVKSQRLKLKDTTIQAACSVAGISHTTWHKVENGDGPHAKNTLRGVARAIGVSAKVLYDKAGIAYDEAEFDDEIVEATDEALGLQAELAELRRRVAELERRLPPSF